MIAVMRQSVCRHFLVSMNIRPTNCKMLFTLLLSLVVCVSLCCCCCSVHFFFHKGRVRSVIFFFSRRQQPHTHNNKCSLLVFHLSG